MTLPGVKTDNISSLIDVPLSLIGNDGNGTGLVPLAALSLVLSASGALGDQLAALVAAVGATVIRADLTKLQAIVGNYPLDTIAIAWGGAGKGVYERRAPGWIKIGDMPKDIAEAAAENALSERLLAAAARLGAEQARDQAAGYVNDIVQEKEVPIHSTVAGMATVEVAAGIQTIRVNGFSGSGDGGGGLYVRATAQPTGEYAGLAFRSLDRFLPNGSSSSGNGGWWAWKEKFDMRQICQKAAARISRGDRYIIACYDDSTGDGNSTTGWTANPTSGQNATGATDHSLDAPNAWPARLAYNLAQYYRNEDLKVLNCGYSGKRIYDGWAYDNFAVAVVQNAITFAGRVPDIVIIGFGINDEVVSTTDPEWINKYISETRRLCRLAMSYGIIPVLKTCDPSWRSDPAGYDSFKIGQMVDAARVAVAQELGLTLLDLGSDLRRWLNNNRDRHNAIEKQTDALHGGDIWCAYKGAAAARYFMRDFITRAGAVGAQRISASDSAMQNSLGQADEFSVRQSRDGAVYTTGHAGGQLAPDGVATDVWIWNEDPQAEIIYRGAAAENVLPADLTAYNRPYHQIFDLTNLGDRGNRIPAGIGFLGTGHGRRADVPYRIGKLSFGMNRVRYRTGNLPFFFVGHYEIRTTSEWQEEPRGAGPSAYAAAMPLNALKNHGRFLMDVERSVVGYTASFMPEADDLSNVVGLMNGDRARLHLRAVIQSGTGVILGWTSSYVDASGARDDKSFIFLYRTGASTVQLYAGTRQNGVITFVQIGANGATTQTPDADGAEKYTIYLNYNSDNLVLSLYEGWDFAAPQLIQATVTPGSLAPPAGFVMGGLFVNNTVAAAGSFFNPKILDYFGKQQTQTLGVPEPALVAP